MFENEQKSLLHSSHFKSAKEIFDIGLASIKSIHSGATRPLVTSIAAENETTGGLYPTDQMVIVGDNSIGLTSRVICMIDDFLNPEINPTFEDNIVVLYNSWETADWRNALKFLSFKSKQTVSELLDIQKQKETQHITMMESLASKYDRTPLYINNRPTTGRAWETYTNNICNKFKDKTIINIVDNTRMLSRVNFTNEESLISDFLYLAQNIKNTHKTINIIVSSLKGNGFTKMPSALQKLPTANDVLAQNAVFGSSDLVLSCYRPGFYGEREFKISPTSTVDTGLTQAGRDDDLWIEDFLKNKYGESRRIYIKHEVKYGRFRSFTDTEKRIKFKTKSIISTDEY